MHNRADEARRLEQRKTIVLKFLAIEPDTLSSLKFIIGGDTKLTEKALYDLVQDGKVAYRGKGMYFARETAGLW